MNARLQFGILGPLEVRASGAVVRVGGPRQRALLGLLLCRANQVVSRDELIEELLTGQPADSAERMLRVQISRLRHTLDGGDGPGRLVARPPGYVLRVGDGELDLQVFEQRVAAGRAALEQGNPGQAAMLLGEAEALWRGRPLADLEFEPFARFEIQRLAELRLLAAEDRIEAGLALGQHAAVCPQLGRLAAEHPLRERLRGQLMLALYRSGRQAEALAVFHDARRVLDAELGIEPGPGLRKLHERMLAADPGLDLPALAALATQPAPVPVPRELPADVSGFTGRAAELAELDRLLPGPAGQENGGAPGAVVISAVAGTAGVGKTALAVRWAHRVAGQFPDGQLYVNLRGYDPGQPVTPGQALAGFLRALGVADAGIPAGEAERAARYRSLAAGRRLLVVLDNASAAGQVRPLLPGSGPAMVVVTSRDALAGLVAVDGARRLDLDLLPTGEAVALLGTLIGPRAAADPAATDALAGLCARLPLALRVAAEMAAARPGMLLADLVAELAGHSDRLELLAAGGDPHAAVASVFSWSCRHLPPDAARMFRLAGLHPAQHWDPCAAAALTGTASLTGAQRLLGVLAQAHLIQPAGAGRYQMHDLLRGYAASQAADHDSDQARQAALTRLFDYYLAASAAAMNAIVPAERHRRPDPPPVSTPVPGLGDRAAARDWLQAELPALMAVAAHAASHGWPGHAIGLASTVYRFLYHGHPAEGLVLHEHALNAARQLNDRAAEARLLTQLSSLHERQDRPGQAAAGHRQALAIAGELGDLFLQGYAWAGLGAAHDYHGRCGQAARSYRRALDLYRTTKDKFGQSWMLANLAGVHIQQGRYQPAAGYLDQALALSREINDEYGMAGVLATLGAVHCRQGRYQQAADHLLQALALHRQTGSQGREAATLTWLAETHRRQGRYRQAAEYSQQALALYRELGSLSGQAKALNEIGDTLLATGQTAPGKASYARALSLARQAGERNQEARAHHGLAETCHAAGDPAEAGQHRQLAQEPCTGLADPETSPIRGDPAAAAASLPGKTTSHSPDIQTKDPAESTARRLRDDSATRSYPRRRPRSTR